MITLYVDGNPIGTWAEAEKWFRESGGLRGVQFRDESGRVIATSAPALEPDWVAAITPEETRRRLAEPGVPFEEMKLRLGWE